MRENMDKYSIDGATGMPQKLPGDILNGMFPILLHGSPLHGSLFVLGGAASPASSRQAFDI